MTLPLNDLKTRLDQVEALQNQLLAQATSGGGDNAAYVLLRRILLDDPIVGPRLPRYVRTAGDLAQFWQWIKAERGTYAERREIIWNDFRPILDHLAGLDAGPAAHLDVSAALARFDAAHVHEVWEKALARRAGDPDGAITAARTLLESVCKHILDRRGMLYPDGADLPKLYGLVAQELRLAPSQHTEDSFKQILAGCYSVVHGLAAVRNRLSDAHGQGRKPVRPAPRHAGLAVNLAGTMALFLVATFEAAEPSASRETTAATTRPVPWRTPTQGTSPRG